MHRDEHVICFKGMYHEIIETVQWPGDQSVQKRMELGWGQIMFHFEVERERQWEEQYSY